MRTGFGVLDLGSFGDFDVWWWTLARPREGGRLKTEKLKLEGRVNAELWHTLIADSRRRPVTSDLSSALCRFMGGHDKAGLATRALFPEHLKRGGEHMKN